MQELLDQLITPEVRMVLYLMVICVVMLYILSIVYVIRDAQRRGAEPWWMWAIISVIPIVGLLACARAPTSSTARSRTWTSPCASTSSPTMAFAPSAAPPSTVTLWSALSATRRSATSAPPAIARSTRTGRSAPTAAPASSSGRASPPHPRPGEKRALLAWPFAADAHQFAAAGQAMICYAFVARWLTDARLW